METIERLRITQSEEYKQYLSALCHLASQYVPRIRKQFALQAFGKFQDTTVRRLVLAYGVEAAKLDESRLRDFDFLSEHPEADYMSMEDSCIIHAGQYGEAIKLLFDIE